MGIAPMISRKSLYDSPANDSSRARGPWHNRSVAKIVLVVLVTTFLEIAEFTRAAKADGPNVDQEATTTLVQRATASGASDLWLPPARNVHPRRRKPKADWDLLARQTYCYSYPSSPPLQSILNPWGEQVPIFRGPLQELSRRILAACEVYRYQNVHFDGYLGSEDDGQHLFAAADGQNVAWFGDNEAKTYRTEVQSLPDTLDERCWICVDLSIFTLTLAGFPIRQALISHFLEAPELYTQDGAFPENVPLDPLFFRRVENLRTYLRYEQFYSEDRITTGQFFDPNYRPPHPFRPGDIILMGHYKDYDNKGPFEVAKHSGIVESVDARGMPVRLYNMRTSNSLIDRYDAVIGQTRLNNGHEVYFHRFSDRYPIICHGRIVQPYNPKGEMPTIETVRSSLAARIAAQKTVTNASVTQPASSAQPLP